MKMKIPKCFHPILGVIIGTVLFLIGIAVLSVAFVGTYKMAQYAKPFVADVFSTIIHNIAHWLPI